MSSVPLENSLLKAVLAGLAVFAMQLPVPDLGLPAAAIAAEPRRMTAASRLNLRAGPGTEHPVAGAVEADETVTVLKWASSPVSIGGQSGRWARIQRASGATGWVFGVFLKPPADTAAVSTLSQTAPTAAQAAEPSDTSPITPSTSRIMPIRSDILPRLLETRGFTAKETFKALLIEIVRETDGSYTYYPMDFRGTSTVRDNWWPASTVKLYAAVAALELLRAWGFDPLKTEVTYDYEDGPFTQSFEEILRLAITDSKNPEFDRLVDIVGSGRLNRNFLVPRNGIRNTVMLRCYSGRTPNPDTGKCSNRVSPSLQLNSGDKEKSLPVRTNDDKLVCENEGNCTTLQDLTEVTRRIMMHEHLPKKERFRLGEKELTLLRDAMSTHVKGGVADAIRLVFKGRQIELFHKGGYADQWLTDNMFLSIKDTGEQWIIGLSDRPGREALNDVAEIVATIIADGTLSKERKKAFAAKPEMVQVR